MFEFYVEYCNGSAKIVANLTKLQAKRQYTAFSKNPESEAKSWGWQLTDPYPLSNQLLAKKATK